MDNLRLIDHFEFEIIIILIIKSTKYVLDILPLFAGSNMRINHFYLSYSINLIHIKTTDIVSVLVTTENN